MLNKRMGSEQRRAEIVRSVLPLFARKGFSSTTTKELAVTARVSEALLYKHFPSKESLYSEIQSFCCQNREMGLPRLASLEPSTSMLVHIIYYLVRSVIVGSPRDSISWETRHRLLLNSCLADGSFARLLFEKRFEACLPAIQASLEAAERCGDVLGNPVNRINRVWFTHHVAAMIATTHLPAKPVLDYQGDRGELLHQSVWFCLRGMGMTDDAISRHYHPEALSLFFELGEA